jgi:hypothetical protein
MNANPQSDSGSAMRSYLDLMDAQRRAVFESLVGIDEAKVWQRPAPKAWSIGEHLDHARLLTRSFRRLLGFCYWVLLPMGWVLRRRPYPTEIDDVYERPGFPLGVGWIWTPRHNARRPAPVSTLAGLFEEEHGRVRRFFEDKDERVLGHIWLYDPPIGRLNIVQALRVGIHHDAHHFRSVERLLEGR